MVSGYLDNAATTPMCDSAKQAFLNSFDNFGNPSSLHKIGVDASILLEKCRNEIADFIGSSKDEIIFTSGGTKSNNLAITGAVKALRRRGNRIVTTGIEHSSVLEPMRELENQGFEVVFLKPDKNGTVPKEQFENAI
ncbi:MAG: aminotransferase class V-fold PLP-dependent enzyme, partial [Oscillospiraceae bacterium]